MKKFMFSSVALVAFSFAGMASNSVEKIEIEVKEEKTTVLVGSCTQLWFDIYDMYFTGENHIEAKKHADDMQAACERIKGIEPA